MEEREPEPRERRPVGLLAFGLVVCLFFGFWGWVYQGYEEDAGTGELQTWPLGLGGYLLAWVHAVLIVRRRWPGLTPVELTVIALNLAALLVLATVGSLDAGNG